MYRTLRVFALAQVVCASVIVAVGAGAQGAPQGDTLIAIAPCRILDTAAAPPSQPGEATLRTVDIRSSRCGRIIPSLATAYSIRITRISKTPPDKLPAGSLPVIGAAQRVAAPADGRLSFPVPADDFIGVDVTGYYVPAGTPVRANATAAAPAEESVRSSSTPRPAATTNPSGSAGTIYLDGSADTTAGVLMIGAAGTPWIAAKSLTSDGGSGFVVTDSMNKSILRVRGDGVVQLAGSTNFFDGRTDFFGSPDVYFGDVTIPTNVVHDVRLVNPRDASGGKTSRITFFNAYTYDEVDSPPVTKFNARTGGYYYQENVNYDSTFHWHHQDNQYHFRAGSTGENKTTFWVKAATNADTFTNTRADMYVSGRVGIGSGTTSVAHALDVAGHNTQSAGSTMQISSEVGSGSSWANQVNITNARAGYGLILGFNGPGMSPLLYHHPNGAHVVNVQNGPLTFGTANAARMTVSGSGSVGIGTSSPMHALDVSGNMTIGSGYTAVTTVPANGLVVEGNVGIGVAAPAAKLHVNGNIVATGSITGATVIGATYQDVAEWVPATKDLSPGTVVVLNPDAVNQVMPSHSEYDARVAGVVSEQPGLILGVAGEAKEMVATTGRVKVKVDATRAPVRVGDLLVTSGQPGVAMKSVPIDVGGVAIHRPGTIIGKALEPLPGGMGEILVLLSLQ